MDLFVSAGEASSDIHCAQLLDSLRKAAGVESVDAFGLGGDRLAAAGVTLMLHNSEFSVGGGPLEVISKLPKRRRLERMLESRLFEKKPDGAILVDNGEINLRLASLLHFFGVPVVYYIPPKVWAWRPGRLEQIARHVDLVLSILPFEERLYAEWEIPFQYVGNPLLDEVPLALSQDEARSKLGFDSSQDVITVMPGSRHTEIKHHIEIFGESVRLLISGLQRKPIVVVPAAQAIEVDGLRDAFRSKLSGVDVRVFKGMSHECLKAARAALVKSGTSTLEAALLGTPMVLAYASSWSAAWAYKYVVRYRGFVGLVNLFLVDPAEDALGWGERLPPPVVPELILRDCVPEKIARELADVYADGPTRERMVTRLRETVGRLRPPAELGGSPSQAAAAAVLRLLQSGAKNHGA